MDIDTIQKRRKELNMTYKDLSERSGIPERTIYSILLGKTPTPRIDTIEAIEKALGLSKDEIDEGATFARKKQYLSAEEDQLLNIFRGMSAADQKTLINVAWEFDKFKQIFAAINSITNGNGNGSGNGKR